MTSLALNRSLSSHQLRSDRLPANSATLPSPASTTPAPLLLRAWHWLQTKLNTKADTAKLQVSSSLSLGDKRSVCVIQVDGRKFLVGGTPNTVVMLADLGPVETFGAALHDASRQLPATTSAPASKRARAAGAKKTAPKAANETTTSTTRKTRSAATRRAQPAAAKTAEINAQPANVL